MANSGDDNKHVITRTKSIENASDLEDLYKVGTT